MSENGSNGSATHGAEGEEIAVERPPANAAAMAGGTAAAKEAAAATVAAASVAAANDAASAGDSDAATPVSKKARVDESVEEKDFDKETQKALEEIDANQNEIDALNERKLTFSFR